MVFIYWLDVALLLLTLFVIATIIVVIGPYRYYLMGQGVDIPKEGESATTRGDTEYTTSL